jgi:hypothetical protein
MKKKLLFFSFTLLIAAVAIHGQPAIKIFAYQQQSLPGTVPVGIKDENGNPIKKAAAKTNYFIFLSFKKNYIVAPVQVLIKGSSFSLDSFTDVKKTPVEYTSHTIPNDSHKTVLVPKTSNRVIKINPAEPGGPIEGNNHIKSLAKTNDLVIIYMWNKKKYYAALKKITELEPILHE